MRSDGLWMMLAMVLLSGCQIPGLGGGCKTDTDCKGDRVCVSGQCQDQARAHTAHDQGNGAVPPAQQPARSPAAAPDPNVLAPDGMPAEIPAPGSSPPALQEWNAVTREVTVRGSSALNCQTKMIREWLKVRCARQDALVPTTVTSNPPVGVQAFTFNGRELTDLVVQVVRGKEAHATFSWSNNLRRELVVNWPGGAPRPTLYFAGG
jgi:hypothetical protein